MAIMLAACSGNPSSMVSKEDLDFADRFIGSVKAKDFDRIEALLSPELKTGDLRDKIMQVADFFPTIEPESREVVAWNWTTIRALSGTGTSSTAVLLELQYHYRYPEHFPDRWLVVHLDFTRQNSAVLVRDFHVMPLTDSLENTNRFTLDNKSAGEFAFLALAIFVPILILATAVLCLRTPLARRKWLWLIFILCGFGQVSVEWTSGNVFFTPLFFQLLGAGWTRFGLYGPVIIHVGFPLGAILFLVKRRRLGQRSTTA